MRHRLSVLFLLVTANCDAVAAPTLEVIPRAVSSSALPSNGSSANGSISSSGEYIVLSSRASNLGPRNLKGYSDIYLLDRTTGELTIVSTGVGGAPADGDSSRPDITATGIA
jgi:Tol biopolymer transport system component